MIPTSQLCCLLLMWTAILPETLAVRWGCNGRLASVEISKKIYASLMWKLQEPMLIRLEP